MSNSAPLLTLLQTVERELNAGNIEDATKLVGMAIRALKER